jgi:hypothetical protein
MKPDNKQKLEKYSYNIIYREIENLLIDQI